MKITTKQILLRLMSDRKRSVNYSLAGGLAICGVAISYISISLNMGALQCTTLVSVAVAVLLGGAGPGIFATVIGAFGLGYFFITPSTLFNSPDNLLRIAAFFFASFICGSIVNELRKAYRESEASLLVAERESAVRAKVIGIVAHDLRNPLMNLSMKVDILRKEAVKYTPEGKSLKCFDSMWFSTQRMARIIDDLLDATRIDNGNFTLQPTACRVDILLDEIVQGHQGLGSRAKVALRSQVHPGLRELHCDPFRVAQALSNLIQNAIKHSPEHSAVLISAEHSNSKIHFVVSDAGNGVPVELGEQIFDAYTTGSKNGACPGSTGAGLGLFISRAIARCHGGDLKYRNKSEGGAEFTLSLPIDSTTVEYTDEQLILEFPRIETQRLPA